MRKVTIVLFGLFLACLIVTQGVLRSTYPPDHPDAHLYVLGYQITQVVGLLVIASLLIRGVQYMVNQNRKS